jgi:hypothetical protein
MSSQQLELPMTQRSSIQRLDISYRERLRVLLSSDLDFHGKSSAYASHNFHAFPAKFPPQLPRKFIEGLTAPGDVVLDPMMGSGTTILEAFLVGRRGIGFDIDPMALRLCKVKVTPLALEETATAGNQVLHRAQESLQQDGTELRHQLDARFEEAEQVSRLLVFALHSTRIDGLDTGNRARSRPQYPRVSGVGVFGGHYYQVGRCFEGA